MTAIMNENDRKLIADYLADPTRVALPSRIVDLLEAHFARGTAAYAERMRVELAEQNDWDERDREEFQSQES